MGAFMQSGTEPAQDGLGTHLHPSSPNVHLTHFSAFGKGFFDFRVSLKTKTLKNMNRFL